MNATWEMKSRNPAPLHEGLVTDQLLGVTGAMGIRTPAQQRATPSRTARMEPHPHFSLCRREGVFSKRSDKNEEAMEICLKLANFVKQNIFLFSQPLTTFPHPHPAPKLNSKLYLSKKRR